MAGDPITDFFFGSGSTTQTGQQSVSAAHDDTFAVGGTAAHSVDNSQSATSSAKNTNTQANTAQAANTTSLDAGTIAHLQKAVADAQSGAVFSPGTLAATSKSGGVADAAIANALTTRSSINANYDALANKAKLDYNNNTVADINNQAQKVGSTDNSFVELMKNKGRTDLDTNLAAIGANLDLSGATAQNAALSTAAGASDAAQKQTFNLDTAKDSLTAVLAQVLKGGVVASNTTGTSSTGTVETGNTQAFTAQQKAADTHFDSEQRTMSDTNQSGSGFANTQNQQGIGKVILDFVGKAIGGAGGMAAA